MRLSPNYHGLLVFGLALGSLLVGIVMARGIKAHDEIVSVSPFSRPVDRKSEVRISGLIKSVPVVDYTPIARLSLVPLLMPSTSASDTRRPMFRRKILLSPAGIRLTLVPVFSGGIGKPKSSRIG